MKFVKKMPRTDKELSEKLTVQGWKKLKEPRSMQMAILASLPFLLLSLGLAYFVILPFYNLLVPIRDFVENGFSFSINLLGVLGGLAALYAYVTLHELLHGMLVPNWLKSDKTFWGVTVQGGFVFTTEELSKSRFLLISIFPYLVLTVGVGLLCGLLGMLSSLVMLLIIVNAAGSCVDFLSFALIAAQVPNGCRIINNGFETFYR